MYTGYQLVPVRQRRTPKNTSVETLCVFQGLNQTINGHQVVLLATTIRYRSRVRRNEWWRRINRERIHRELSREFGKGIDYARNRFPECYETIIDLFEASQG